MANAVLNRANHVFLGMSKECIKGKEFAKSGYQLSGRINGFVCDDCYKLHYSNEFPAGGKIVDLDNPEHNRTLPQADIRAGSGQNVTFVAAVVAMLILIGVIGLAMIAQSPSDSSNSPPTQERIETNQQNTSLAAEEWYKKAGALWQDGKFTDPNKAIEYLSEAIRLLPDAANAYNNRGLAYADLGQHQRAIVDYNEAIRLNPNDALLYYNRGLTYADLGQHQRAIVDYNEAIRLNPNDALAYINRGLAYSNMNDTSRACSDVRKACNMGNCKVYAKAKDKGYCR